MRAGAAPPAGLPAHPACRAVRISLPRGRPSTGPPPAARSCGSSCEASTSAAVQGLCTAATAADALRSPPCMCIVRHQANSLFESLNGNTAGEKALKEMKCLPADVLHFAVPRMTVQRLAGRLRLVALWPAAGARCLWLSGLLVITVFHAAAAAAVVRHGVLLHLSMRRRWLLPSGRGMLLDPACAGHNVMLVRRGGLPVSRKRG